MKRLQKMMFLAAAFCWLLFGAGFGLMLIPFFLQGAGMQLFGPLESILSVSAGSVMMGLVHVVGMATAALICFAVSYGLFERALTIGAVSEK